MYHGMGNEMSEWRCSQMQGPSTSLWTAQFSFCFTAVSVWKHTSSGVIIKACIHVCAGPVYSPKWFGESAEGLGASGRGQGMQWWQLCTCNAVILWYHHPFHIGLWCQAFTVFRCWTVWYVKAFPTILMSLLARLFAVPRSCCYSEVKFGIETLVRLLG